MFLKPSYNVDGDITDVDLDQLFADGIRALILDLDSTLVAPRSGEVTPAVHQWLNIAKLRFKMAVVSNNGKREYVNSIADILQIPVLGGAVKPRRSGFLRAAEMLGVTSDKVAVVGDRPLTDIWGGSRAGMKTVLVHPLKTTKETKLVRYVRKLERLLIKN